MRSPDGGFLWNRYRNKSLRAWGWRALHSEPGCFLYEDTRSGSYARLLEDTDDFLLVSSDLNLLERLIGKLRNEWDVTEEQPVSQHMGIAIEKMRTELSCQYASTLNSCSPTLECQNATLLSFLMIRKLTLRPAERTSRYSMIITKNCFSMESASLVSLLTL